MITHARLLEVLSYSPDTGAFSWLVKPRPVKPGASPGRYNNGYLEISIDKRRYQGHRLAWLYVHGEWPQGEIDHINGNPSDNRMANLRVATRTQNSHNTRVRKDARCGLKGAIWFKPTGRWRANIQVDGVRRSLGYYDTPEEAHAAYCRAARELFGEFARTG